MRGHFWAGRDARGTSDTSVEVDDRMQRRGVEQARFSTLLECRHAHALTAPMLLNVEQQD
jgi:hypothetical protein